MMTSLEIAQATKMQHITKIAEKIGILEDELELYGKYKAKINGIAFKNREDKKNGKLVLVTATNPTPFGEGKTTVTIGLAQGMQKIGKKSIIALREPSMGPVFGIKGGAAGGGYSQVLPMEDINLHFTGDMHAITSANNLLCALVDNHIHQGNELNIDPKSILIKRCLDTNDRALRNIVIGLGDKINGQVREDGFIITVATEIMAILCLSLNINDLKEKLGNILVGYSFNSKPIYAKDLNAQGSMATILKDAINPNLVQSLEGVPALVHGGPFANIAHGCNSIIATKLALKLGDYCITEAGFGADLGAEKFLDIKCRAANLKPDCIVVVSTVRSLVYNSKNNEDEVTEQGLENLGVHIENMKKYGVPVIVTLNHFENDKESNIEKIRDYCLKKGCEFTISNSFSEGGQGTLELAKKVCIACEKKSDFKFLYDVNLSIKEKILKIANEIYRAKEVKYSTKAEKQIKEIEKIGKWNLPICVAKTQYSLSDDPEKLGAPKNFEITIRELSLSSGAGFIVVLAGNILKMPGLPKSPASNKIDIDENQHITGLF